MSKAEKRLKAIAKREQRDKPHIDVPNWTRLKSILRALGYGNILLKSFHRESNVYNYLRFTARGMELEAVYVDMGNHIPKIEVHPYRESVTEQAPLGDEVEENHVPS